MKRNYSLKQLSRMMLLTATFLICFQSGTRAFTYIFPYSYSTSCTKPLVLLPDSLYAYIDEIPFSVNIEQQDYTYSTTNILSLDDVFLNDTGYFASLGSITLTGQTYHVYRFIYSDYELANGTIGYIDIAGNYNEANINSGITIKACGDCSLQTPVCLSRFSMIYSYIFLYRRYVNSMPYASLDYSTQSEMAKLLNWHTGNTDNPPTIAECMDVLDYSHIGNSVMPASFCNTTEINCACVTGIASYLDDLGSGVISEGHDIYTIQEELRLYTGYDCGFLSKYFARVQSSADGSQKFVFLIPLEANYPAWILHIADGLYRISYSYNFTGGINGIYNGSVYTNGTFSNNNNFIPYAPIEAIITSSDTDNIIYVGDTVVLTANPAGFYLWSTGEITQSIVVSPAQNTTYFLTVTDLAGCSDWDSVRVNIQPLQECTNIYKFFIARLYHDSIIHIVWEADSILNSIKINIEKSYDGISFYEENSISTNNLFDIHINDYPTNISYYKNILYSTEHGNGRFLYNDFVDTLSNSGIYYRIRFETIDECYLSQVVNIFDSINILSDQTHTDISNGQTTQINSPCPSVQTVPINYISTSNSIWHYCSCGMWEETEWIEMLTPECGSVSTWCCNNNPEAASCSSQNSYDPCCVHICSEYSQCVCIPWNCCQIGSHHWLVTQVINFPPLSISYSSQNLCNNSPGNIIVTVNNGVLPFIYQWSTGQTTNAIYNLSAGVYTVTVTDANDCSAIQTISIQDITPSCSFYVANDYCMTHDITFTPANPDPTNCTYHWDFGDGTTSGNMTELHSFSEPGLFHVCLSVVNNLTGCDNECCYDIYVAPHVDDEYNSLDQEANCCSENYPYSKNADITITQAQSPVEWPINVTSLHGNVYVEENAVLNITNKYIRFSPHSKIIVKNSGTLNIINSTLDGIDCCPPGSGRCIVMWQGIEVWGVATRLQTEINSNGNLYQGKVYLEDANIYNAHNAVVLGKPNGSGFSLHYSGGIIDATTGTNTFKGDAVSIKFAKYNFHSRSKFKNCIFDGVSSTGHLLDPGYHTGNSYFYPNQYNLSYAPANWNWRSPYTNLLWGAKNVFYWDNTFKNAEKGIVSYDSKLIIRKSSEPSGNLFTELTEGIFIKNTTSTPLGANLIWSNTFNKITNNHIYIEAGKYDNISQTNYFGTTNNPIPNNQMGIYLRNSSAFTVKDNRFRKLNDGIRVYSSALSGGMIGYETYGNEFLSCNRGVYTSGDNSNLQIHCNVFTPALITTSPWYHFNWYIGYTLADQGNIVNPTTDPYSGAGDQFYTANRKQVKSISYPFKYVYNLPAFTKPVLVGPFTIGDYFANNQPFDPATSCVEPSGNGNSGNINKLAALADSITLLENEFTQVYDNLDKGQKEFLLGAINSYNNSGQLKNLLIANSPLSDDVILAYINRTKQVTPGHFKEVMIPNSPVSEDVLPVLLNKLASLPPGISMQIKAAQGYNPDFRTLTAINNEIKSVKSKRQLILNMAVSYYLEKDSLDLDSAVNLLETENTEETNKILLSYYLSEGDSSSVIGKMSVIPGNSDENIDILTLSGIQLNLMRSGKNEFDMDSTQVAAIREIAADCPATLATSYAQGILSLVYGEEFSLACDTLINNNLKIINNDYSTESNSEFNYLLQNVPNPASDKTEIYYILPDDCTNAVLNIYDASGKKVNSLSLNKNNVSIIVDASELTSGIYLYGLETDGIIIEYKKMNIVKTN
ncbi:MAG: PKD domain-containing protein [Bacteroidota bacterium]